MTEEARRIKNETMRKYREANKDKIKEYQKRYVAKHKREIYEKQKEWRKNNPDKIKQYTLNYWEKKAKEFQVVGD